MQIASSVPVVLARIGIGVLCMIVPGIVALMVTFLRWSPLLLPYHIFGDKYQLLGLEMIGSFKYWSVVLLDWTILTGAALGLYSGCVMCFDAMIRIGLICKALR